MAVTTSKSKQSSCMDPHHRAALMTECTVGRGIHLGNILKPNKTRHMTAAALLPHSTCVYLPHTFRKWILLQQQPQPKATGALQLVHIMSCSATCLSQKPVQGNNNPLHTCACASTTVQSCELTTAATAETHRLAAIPGRLANCSPS